MSKMNDKTELELLREIRELRELLSQETRTRKIQQDRYNRLKEYVESTLKLLKCGCEGNPLPVDVKMKEELGLYSKNQGTGC